MPKAAHVIPRSYTPGSAEVAAHPRRPPPTVLASTVEMPRVGALKLLWFAAVFAGGCHEDAKCPPGMVVDETLGYCVAPDASLDAGGGTDGGGSDAGPCLYFHDGDGDTYGDDSITMSACTPPSGWVRVGGDCDDTSPAVHPGAAETCNGADDNCNGTADDGFLCARGAMTPCTTTCGSTGTTLCGPTCEPMPGCAPPAETCNYADDDCDGMVDEEVLTPGPPIDLGASANYVYATAVTGAFVVALVKPDATGTMFTFDLIRIADDGTVTHTVRELDTVASFAFVALATRGTEVVMARPDASGVLVAQRFTAADLARLAPAVTIDASATPAAPFGVAVTAGGYLVSEVGSPTVRAIFKLQPDLSRGTSPFYATISDPARFATAAAGTVPTVVYSSSGTTSVRTVSATDLSLSAAVSIGAGGVPVAAYSMDGSILAILRAVDAGGAAEPELRLVDGTTFVGGTTLRLPGVPPLLALGLVPPYGVAANGGHFWIAHVVSDSMPGFLSRFRVVEIAADGTALGAGVGGASPYCDPPDADCDPRAATRDVAIAAGGGRVLVATASDEATAWVYGCR